MTSTYEYHINTLNTSTGFVFNYIDNYEIFNDVFENKNFDNLDEDPIKYDILGVYYTYILKDDDEGIKYFMMACGLNNSSAMYNLGKYYGKHKNYEEMKKYYLMAIEQNCSNAMFVLGLYYDIEHNYEEMKKYYLMAIDQNHSSAMFNLGFYYDDIEHDYENMKKYYLMAIAQNDSNAMHNLGLYYNSVENNYELSIKYYIMAIPSSIDKITFDEKLYTIIDDSKCSFYIKWQLLKTHNLLHVTKKYNKFNNKVLRTLKYNIREYCPICMEDDVLCIDFDCGHPICITCYEPKMLCYYRC